MNNKLLLKSLIKTDKEKKEIYAICFSILFLCLVAVFLILKPFKQPTVTGFAITTENVTRDDALKAIAQAEKDMQEMIESGFGVVYIKDTLIVANLSLERADFANLLRSDAASELAEKARKALEGLDYKGFVYSDVLEYTEEIATRKKQAYEISDSLRALELKIEDYKEMGVKVNESIDIFNQAKDAFKNERYEEAEKFLSDGEEQLEASRAEITIAKVITEAGKNFIQKYWLKLLIALIIISPVAYISWKKIRKTRVKNKLDKLKTEQETILKLMRETQAERFKEGKIPESTYKIRMDKFRERATEIKHTIPVLEAILEGKKTKGKTKEKLGEEKKEAL